MKNSKGTHAKQYSNPLFYFPCIVLVVRFRVYVYEIARKSYNVRRIIRRDPGRLGFRVYATQAFEYTYFVMPYRKDDNDVGVQQKQCKMIQTEVWANEPTGKRVNELGMIL